MPKLNFEILCVSVAGTACVNKRVLSTSMASATRPTHERVQVEIERHLSPATQLTTLSVLCPDSWLLPLTILYFFIRPYLTLSYCLTVLLSFFFCLFCIIVTTRCVFNLPILTDLYVSSQNISCLIFRRQFFLPCPLTSLHKALTV